jgi:hypothetical protein
MCGEIRYPAPALDAFSRGTYFSTSYLAHFRTINTTQIGRI